MFTYRFLVPDFVKITIFVNILAALILGDPGAESGGGGNLNGHEKKKKMRKKSIVRRLFLARLNFFRLHYLPLGLLGCVALTISYNNCFFHLFMLKRAKEATMLTLLYKTSTTKNTIVLIIIAFTITFNLLFSYISYRDYHIDKKKIEHLIAFDTISFSIKITYIWSMICQDDGYLKIQLSVSVNT